MDNGKFAGTPFELPQHPHPAAQNDTQRVIETNSKAIIIVHAIDGAEAEQTAKSVVRACNAHDDLKDIAEKALAAFSYLAIRATSKEDREEFKRREVAARAALTKAGAA